jgi:hypothetical protein
MTSVKGQSRIAATLARHHATANPALEAAAKSCRRSPPLLRAAVLCPPQLRNACQQEAMLTNNRARRLLGREWLEALSML